MSDLPANYRAGGIPHAVLNARNGEQEAAIIARAGERSAVTISTNMAGRGVDIRLGGGVAELGGLDVIATNRSESRLPGSGGGMEEGRAGAGASESPLNRVSAQVSTR